MTNTIIDFIRIPVDGQGNLLYDMDYARQIYECYIQTFPDHIAFMMPADITIWEDVDLEFLKSTRDYLTEIIVKKEQ